MNAVETHLYGYSLETWNKEAQSSFWIYFPLQVVLTLYSILMASRVGDVEVEVVSAEEMVATIAVVAHLETEATGVVEEGGLEGHREEEEEEDLDSSRYSQIKLL